MRLFIGLFTFGLLALEYVLLFVFDKGHPEPFIAALLVMAYLNCIHPPKG